MSETLSHVEIYTDGACSGNPGPGGWAAILKAGDAEKEISGYEAETTNNRMELLAVINGLKSLKKRCKVTVYSDSAYVVNAFRQNWLENWKRNGWKRGPRKNQPVLNSDLWQELDRLIRDHEVRFEKVAGHSGHEYNERVDELAVQEIRNARE